MDVPQKESDTFSWKNNKSGMGLVIAILSVISVIAAIGNVWGDKRPIGSFFEEFVAISAHWVMLVGSIWFAGWAGTRIYEKIGSKFVGWIVGISVFLGFGFFVMTAVSNIPGVNWRFEKLFSGGDDY